MNNEKQLTHFAFHIAIGTTFSRIFGYFRDMLVAHLFGAGLIADAFYAAYRIPNLIRRLLGEGSISASFIPVLSEYLCKKTKQETQEVINVLFTALLFILTILTLLGIIFAPQIVGIIAYGFKSNPEKLNLTINLTRLMFPFVFFVCLAAISLGVLNTLNSFFIPAIAPASLSLSEIIFILGIAPLLDPPKQVLGLTISVIIGGIGQMGIQWAKILNLGWELKIKLNFSHPAIKQTTTLMLPVMLGLSVDQINSFVDTICASFLEQGSITALYYSNRVMQLPLAIFGIALSSAALPSMSKAVAEKDFTNLKSTINYSIRLIFFILLPSAIGLLSIGLPIIKILFERGNFDSHASYLTYMSLAFYVLGLPAYACVKIFANSFYAFKETKIPVKIATIAMLVNILLNIILMRPLGVGGLALATSISSSLNSILLAIKLRQKIGRIGLKSVMITIVKTLIAAILMGIVSGYIAFKVFTMYSIIGTIIAIICGVGLFFLLSHILKIKEYKSLLYILLNEKPTGED